MSLQKNNFGLVFFQLSLKKTGDGIFSLTETWEDSVNINSE